jgi:hypothetical protein
VNGSKYAPILADRKKLGHNLEAVVEAVMQEIGGLALDPLFRTEIRMLNQFYIKHEFRYGSAMDTTNMTVGAISERLTHRKLVKAISIMNRLVAAEHSGNPIHLRVTSRKARLQQFLSNPLRRI